MNKPLAYAAVLAVVVGWLIFPQMVEAWVEKQVAEKLEATIAKRKEAMCLDALRWHKGNCYWINLSNKDQ